MIDDAALRNADRTRVNVRDNDVLVIIIDAEMRGQTMRTLGHAVLVVVLGCGSVETSPSDGGDEDHDAGRIDGSAGLGDVDAGRSDAGPDAAPDAGACPFEDVDPAAGAANNCQEIDYPGAPGCHVCVIRFVSDNHTEAHAGDCCDFQVCLDTFGPWKWGPCE